MFAGYKKNWDKFFINLRDVSLFLFPVANVRISKRDFPFLSGDADVSGNIITLLLVNRIQIVYERMLFLQGLNYSCFFIRNLISKISKYCCYYADVGFWRYCPNLELNISRYWLSRGETLKLHESKNQG